MTDGNDDIRLIQGDCLSVLPTLDDNSVDSIVTDPPYGLRFLGRKWDYDVPSVAIWEQCLRVLKPGGHLMAFAGTRTQHRMAVRIEDAGFEIRDMIAWNYAGGFPKSLDVSKAIDKARDDGEDRRAVGSWLRQQRKSAGLTQKEVAANWPSISGGLTGCVANWELGLNCPKWDQWLDLKREIGFGDEKDDEVWRLNGRKGKPGEAWGDREVVGRSSNGIAGGTGCHAGTENSYGYGRDFDLTAPATLAARQWQGWGTSLKPAMEPITVARKPLVGAVADNVLAHGTGAINIDGCRVGMDGQGASDRWPANFLHDGSDEATGPLGPAARYFFCAKASRADRGPGNDWPTVKPTDLMRYLVRLVTPPDGTTLDPFLGSGSTGKAAVLEGFRFVGIELDDHAMAIARRRIDAARLPMFDRPEPAAPTSRAAQPEFAFATEDDPA